MQHLQKGTFHNELITEALTSYPRVLLLPSLVAISLSTRCESGTRKVPEE